MVKKLSYEQLLPDLSDLTLRSVVETENGWIVEAEGAASAICPTCGVVSHSRHSRYWRRIRDLPLQGTSVTLKLQLGRWRCRSQECVRQIFTERVEGVLVPHAQQTNRLGEIRILIGRALGGRPGQRMLSRLGMPASRHTLLRQVTRAARGVAFHKVIRVLGVDDWAWSKGQSFGTILVDLESSEVVDLLPTRSADSLSEWLSHHPEVVVVSRDRHGIYAEGARRGAPEAVQVADRFSPDTQSEPSGRTRTRSSAATSMRVCAVHTGAADRPGTEDREASRQANPSPLQYLEATSGNCPTAAAAEARSVSDYSANEMRWPEGDADRSTAGHQPTAHR